MDKKNMELADLMKYFNIYNQSDGKSPATLRWYDEAITTFLGWLKKTGRPVTLGSIDENTFREFILWLQERRVKDHMTKVGSVSNRVRALRSFFNWLYRKGYTETHILQDVKPPRLPQVLVDTLSEDEVTMIMASQDRFTMNGSRNLAIPALFLDTGLRLSELVGLNFSDVHVEDQFVKVLGKGSKERMVAFGNSTRNVLLHYFVHFRGEPAHAGVKAFFL